MSLNETTSRDAKILAWEQAVKALAASRLAGTRLIDNVEILTSAPSA